MIEQYTTRAGFNMNLKHPYREYYWFGGAWVPLTNDVRDSEEYENYNYGVAHTIDLVTNIVENYIPGVIEYCDHSDLSIMVDMNEVEERGWTKERLIENLQAIADLEVFESDEPWHDCSTDSWGDKRYYYRHPHIKPPVGLVPVEKFLRELEI